MRYSALPIFLILLLLALSGCNAYQPAKNVWKSTKGLWNTYVSPPANVDYEDHGNLPPEAIALSSALMGIDMELAKLERVMQNADRPPTQEWLNELFAKFPWLNGFAGVKYDGTILGQEPPDSMKQLDFIPLLYEDKKQNSRALRADIQPTPLGPEVMLAAPLYDGMDFLGIVVAYFDMRSLMRFSDKANEIVALAPGALLWPGKYEYAATPLAGVDWAKVVRESAAGKCSNSTGSFFYMVRYLGNLPLVFAIPAEGTFPEGNGDISQGAAYFPQEREKLPPPPMPERKPDSDRAMPAFEKPEPIEPHAPEMAQPAQPAPASDKNVIPAGSRESMLLKGGRAKARREVHERALDGDNIEVIRAPERRQRPARQIEPEEPQGSHPSGGRPSPFGPQEEKAPAYERPSPFGPRESTSPTPAAKTEDQGQAAAHEAAGATQPAEPLADGEPGGGVAAETEARATRSSESTGAVPPVRESPAKAQPAQSAPESSEVQPDAEPLADGEPNERPATMPTLPGGRPSPFGPGK